MKTKLFILIAISFGLFALNSKNTEENFTPPGTVKIGTNIFMDATEITNMNWREYMYWNERIYGKTSEQYIATIPDTNVWTKEYKTLYLTHPAYGEYPVVGISWKQAVVFCNWRSDRVMEHLLIKKEMNPKMIIPKKLEYRLPTIEEWENIAGAGYEEKTQHKLDKKYADSPKANFKSEKQDITVNTTAPVHQYWPNKLGTYNMLGNVAEMTNEEGVAKGGSWVQLESEVSIDKDFEYKNPENWIGFRCLCEVEY